MGNMLEVVPQWGSTNATTPRPHTHSPCTTICCVLLWGNKGSNPEVKHQPIITGCNSKRREKESQATTTTTFVPQLDKLPPKSKQTKHQTEPTLLQSNKWSIFDDQTHFYLFQMLLCSNSFMPTINNLLPFTIAITNTQHSVQTHHFVSIDAFRSHAVISVRLNLCVELGERSGYFNLTKHASGTSVAINNGEETLNGEVNVCRLQWSATLALFYTYCKNVNACSHCVQKICKVICNNILVM